MNEINLYKRDAKGNILIWHIQQYNNGNLCIAHGLLGHNLHSEIIECTLTKVNELESRVKTKRKEGYKSIEDLYDNAPKFIENETNLHSYLNTYLPKYNTTTEGFILPMLSKVLEDNKPFEKCGTMLGDWKINGLRCIVGATKEDDLFGNVTLTYHSREGEDWTNKLRFMDEIILPKIDWYVLGLMIEEGVCLDGEMYLPGYSVNEINSFIKNCDLPQHYRLQYWIFDLCIDCTTATTRKDIINKHVLGYIPKPKDFTKEWHLNNKERVIIIPTSPVEDIQKATAIRDTYIDMGFEGLIVRDPLAEYAFGKRNSSMFKYKKKLDGLFTIIGVNEDKRGLPIFTILNDINEETFECTYNATQYEQRYIVEHYYDYITKKCLVEYRERSGVKQVPFHAKIIKIYV